MGSMDLVTSRQELLQAHVPRCIAFTAAVLLAGVAKVALAAPPAPGKHGRTAPPPGSISRLNLRAATTGGKATTTTTRKAQPELTRLAALRVEFPNLAFGESPPADELHDRFFYEVWFEHVRQYFDVASKGRAVVSVFVADNVALAAHEQEYYGDFAHYDSLMIELTSEVVQFFDPSVDFSQFDGIILLHAGPGQESDINGDSPLQIWSGYLDQSVFEEQLSTPDSTITGIPTADGTEIRDVIILPEWQVQDLPPGGGTRLGHIGVYAHEIGQKLGMIPLFDADPSPFPDSQGIGNFGLMGYGLWVANGFIPSLPSAFNQALVGWVDPIEVDGSTTVELRDFERGAPGEVVARVPISQREYFLVSYIVEDPDGPLLLPCDSLPQRYFNFNDANGDCRFNYEDLDMNGVMSIGDLLDTYEGAEWNFFMTDLNDPPTFGEGWGLLLQHVDELVFEEVLERSNNVQSDPRRKGVDIEEADGIEDLDRGADNVRSFGSKEDYFGLAQPFGVATIPNSRSTNGAPTQIEIELIELPDALPSSVDPGVLLPGGRARVRVRRVPPDLGRSPERTARRVVDGRAGADLVTLPLASGIEAIVVPAPDGRVHLLDPALDEAPVSDGDPDTLVPWVTVPPELAGSWVASPAVGDVNGDAVPDLVLAANADSAASPRARLFGWDRSGLGLGVGGSPLLGSLLGDVVRTLVLDLDLLAGDEAVLAAQSPAGVALLVVPSPVAACPTPRTQAVLEPAGSPGAFLLGGPVGVDWPLEECVDRGLAWVEADTLLGVAELWYRSLACCDPRHARVVLPDVALEAMQMVAGDLNGDGRDVVVVADAAGTLLEVSVASAGLQVRGLATLADAVQTPLALGDVDGNATLEIIVGSTRAVHALSFSGASLPGWPYPLARDPYLAIEPNALVGAGSPLVADLDGEGDMEILVHTSAGAALVWDGHGARRTALEAAFAASDVVSARAADIDADGRLEVVSLARFDSFARFDPVTRQRHTEARTEIALWEWPQSGEVAWSGLGGEPGVSFHSDRAVEPMVVANDATLPSFVVVPNPVADALRARVELTAPAHVRCALYNIEGEVVQQQSRDGQTGEVVEFTFDVREMASGIYLARMQLSTGGTRVRAVAVRR